MLMPENELTLREQRVITGLCPECDGVINSEEINLQEGIGICGKCGAVIRLSELNYSGRSQKDIIDDPPEGCGLESSGAGVLVTVSLRSRIKAIGACVASLAIIGFLGFVGRVSIWLIFGQSDEMPQNVRWVFLFVMSWLVLALVHLQYRTIKLMLEFLMGRNEVFVDEQQALVATQVGMFRWTKRFDPNQVRSVELVRMPNWEHEETTKSTIEIQADRVVQLGSWLDSEKRVWLLAVLKKLLPSRGVDG
jgi:hypothetical protein